MHRLRRKTDIQRIFREGRRLDSPCVVLYARRRAPDEGLPLAPRLAVVAGRRFRMAVRRNRARRLLRELARAALGRAPLPWDLILVARTQLLALPFAEGLAQVSDLLQRAHITSETAVQTP